MTHDPRELFPFGIIPGEPAGAAHPVALIQRIAAETFEMNNRTAWREILPRLRAAGVPPRVALGLCRDVWDARKGLKAAGGRCAGERT